MSIRYLRRRDSVNWFRESHPSACVGLSNILDSEVKRGAPMERPHREVVGAAVMGSKLFGEVLQGEEGMAGIKAFLVLPVAALHFAVVSGCIGTDQLVLDSQVSSSTLK